MKIAGVQMDIELGDVARNMELILSKLTVAAGKGAELVVFPECAVSGYCFDSYDEASKIAETIPGPSTNRLVQECEKLGVHLVVGLLEKSGDDLFNAAALLGPGGVVGTYRKTHLPYLGVDMVTTGGKEPYRIFEITTRSGTSLRIGMNICYDISFPEASRVLALEGADLIALPTNWSTGAEGNADIFVAARALENHIYFIAVNRVGQERGFRFIGRSSLCEPSGTALDSAPHAMEAIIYGEIDPELARNKKIVRVPGKHEIDRFADRRPDLYGKVCEDS